MTDTPSLAVRIGEGVLGLVLGVAYALIATVAHQQLWRLGSVELPWGLVLGIVGLAALLAGLRLLAETRWAAAGAAVGVVGIVSLLSLPGETVLIPDNLLGVVWAVAPALVAAVVLAWPSIPARRRA